MILLASLANAQTFNGSILEQQYNLTGLLTAGNDSAIDSPTNWLAAWNQQLGNIGIVTFLYVFAALLFLIIRRKEEVKDSEAGVYAGLMGTVLGVFLFVIDITNITDYKLITWAQLLPIVVLTGFAIYSNIMDRNF